MQRKKNVLVIASDYYKEISDNLLKETITELSDNNLQYTVEIVTGVFEIPSIITFAKNKFDGYIVLGCVIRGETSHYDYVCSEVAKGISRINLDTSVPIAFGVLTTDTIEQAIERAGTKAGNKGWEAALTAIEMTSLLENFRTNDL